jgi:hypothetical protein
VTVAQSQSVVSLYSSLARCKLLSMSACLFRRCVVSVYCHEVTVTVAVCHSLQYQCTILIESRCTIVRVSNYISAYLYRRCVVRGRKLALRYLQGWFTLDLLSTFPFDHVVQLFSHHHGSGNNAILRSTKVSIILLQ